MQVSMEWAIHIVKTSPLFDEAWYRQTYHLAADVDAARHYITEGYKKGWNPSPYFSTEEYLIENDDVRLAGDQPLLHYEIVGHGEGRWPHLPVEIARRYKRCACCGHPIGKYAPLPAYYAQEIEKYHGTPGRSEMVNPEEYSCPYCGAADRDRAYAVYLRRTLPPNLGGVVLDIAPSAGMRTLFQTYFPQVQYRTADLMMPGVDYQMDIMDMREIPDGSVDVFICSHVLEHVTDDRKAMRELRRILAPTGRGILVVPIDLDCKALDEDPTVTDVGERWRRFGQDDHIRKYTREAFIERILETGFHLEQVRSDFFGPVAMYENALLETSTVYVVTK